MRKLIKPKHDAGETFALCISAVKDKGLRKSLEDLRSKVEAAAENYEKTALQAEWYRIAKTGKVGGVEKKELVNTYKNRMAKSGSPGRSVYDELRVVPQKRCPLCAQRDVSTLDHYLPESHYSLFVVSPTNLVPSCKDCNFKKRNRLPASIEEQTFHPYYDDFDDGAWLKAELVDVDPTCAMFEVVRQTAWSREKYKRACHHFQLMELAELYSDHAAGELTEMRSRLINLFVAGGKDAVREDLESSASSIGKVYRNSWRGALYQAAATTEWFFNGGFKRIST